MYYIPINKIEKAKEEIYLSKSKREKLLQQLSNGDTHKNKASGVIRKKHVDCLLKLYCKK